MIVEESLGNEMEKYLPFKEGSQNYSADNIKTFVKRIIHHNLLVFQKYYSKISLARISTLLGVRRDEAEK